MTAAAKTAKRVQFDHVSLTFGTPKGPLNVVEDVTYGARGDRAEQRHVPPGVDPRTARRSERRGVPVGGERSTGNRDPSAAHPHGPGTDDDPLLGCGP